MALQQPLINGQYPDFSCIEAKFGLNATKEIKVKEINYTDSLEPGEVRANHAQILGSTRGEYKAEGSLALFLPQFKILVDFLGDGFGEKVFTLVVNYRMKGMDMITDTVQACRIKKPDASQSAGADPLERKLDLHVQGPIKWNGKTLLEKVLPDYL